jgi:hypothetical protein
LLKAGITQYHYFLFHERESKKRLKEAMASYSTSCMHCLESLQYLEAADAFDHLSTQIRWANHFNTPLENPAALKSWNDICDSVACTIPRSKIPDYTSFNPVIPKTRRCKMCYKCGKHGHIRATCPGKPVRKRQGYM